ncbi:MAG: 2-C-methyl-D-erythritol 4-phosphate cytidylyltransferase [Thermosediminibacterales bacterium]|nr:2-C-methyl-D-erythritol 4-phosphate cytidylyltransferase [Thermosediminibacterales bacterium]MDK2836394.1 2-C-methyl-D-erythritol 4-phosphate cytidylyltransferase [Thermosediminibacterales bacterium]
MKVSAIIVAAGQGSRMGANISKQYLHLYGKPILAYTLEIFHSISVLNEIVLVVAEKDRNYCKQKVLRKNQFYRIKLTNGGKTRQQSVFNGLKTVCPQTDFVIIHDGVRPFVKKEEVLEVLDAAMKFDAAALAVPVKDTVKKVNNEGFILSTLNREKIWAVQTPQVFRYNLIKDAHEKAIQDGFSATDDCMLVERNGNKVKIVKGSYENIKITTPEDIILGEAILDWRLRS